MVDTHEDDGGEVFWLPGRAAWFENPAFTEPPAFAFAEANTGIEGWPVTGYSSATAPDFHRIPCTAMSEMD